jgi:hypothetical protein
MSPKTLPLPTVTDVLSLRFAIDGTRRFEAGFDALPIALREVVAFCRLLFESTIAPANYPRSGISPAADYVPGGVRRPTVAILKALVWVYCDDVCGEPLALAHVVGDMDAGFGDSKSAGRLTGTTDFIQVTDVGDLCVLRRLSQ